MSMTSNQAERLGAVIATARSRKSLTVRALAEQLGISFSWITKLEAGQYLDPDPVRLARLSEALDVEPARIDRIAKGAVAQGLPGMRTYFRAKYALSPQQVEQIERYVERLQRRSS